MAKSNAAGVRTRLLLAAILFAGLPLCGLAWYWLITFPDVAGLARRNPASTALMEARSAEARNEGRPLARRWIWVPLARISPHLQNAVVAAEDAAFFSHEGFDWSGIQEATVRNIKSWKLHRGGSTITQQLAKNLYLSSEKKLLRKAHEALLTRSLERHLGKKRILELYLNVVEWGDGIYGAEAAAQHHFGKPARALSPEEAALLAAMLPSPRAYDPLRTTRYLTVRRQQILRWMRSSRVSPVPQVARERS